MPSLRIEEVKEVLVIGAGDMGHGIAEICAINGYNVYLMDIDSKILDNALNRIRNSLKILDRKGKLGSNQIEIILNRISPTLEYNSILFKTNLVIEAVPEIMSLKKSIFRDLNVNLPNTAIIATNTSNMSITELAAQVDNPDRVVGMHFFNPVMLMKTVEIIKSDKTSTETIEFAEDFVYSIKKLPIPVLKDVPGFIVNRVQAPSMLLLTKIVEKQIATPNQVDAIAKKMGQSMGPFEIMDYVGLDICKHGADYFAEKINQEFKFPEWANVLVQEGKLGKKTGYGIYDWSSGRPDIDLDDSTDKVDFTDILIVQVNEAAKLIDMNVVEYPGDIDLAIQNATGNVSGIFWLLKDDREKVINRLNYLADEFKIETFRPTEFLKTMPIPSARKASKARKKARKEKMKGSNL